MRSQQKKAVSKVKAQQKENVRSQKHKLLNTMIRRKAAMCGQHKEHADISTQDFCDLHGKPSITNQILWHGTSGQRHSPTYTRANP